MRDRGGEGGGLGLVFVMDGLGRRAEVHCVYRSCNGRDMD